MPFAYDEELFSPDESIQLIYPVEELTIVLLQEWLYLEGLGQLE